MNEPELRNTAAPWQTGIGAALTLIGAFLAAAAARRLPSSEQSIAYATIPLAGLLGGIGGLLTARSSHRRLLIRLAPLVFLATGVILSIIASRNPTIHNHDFGFFLFSGLLILVGAFLTGFWWHIGRRRGRSIGRSGK